MQERMLLLLPGGGKPLQTPPASDKPVSPHVEDDTLPLSHLLTLLSAGRGLHSSPGKQKLAKYFLSFDIWPGLDWTGRQHRTAAHDINY